DTTCGLVRTKGKARLAEPLQSPARPVRALRFYEMSAANVRLLRSRVLALRVCAAGGGCDGRVICPVPADAGPGQLQSRKCPRPDRQGDRGGAWRQSVRRQLGTRTKGSGFGRSPDGGLLSSNNRVIACSVVIAALASAHGVPAQNKPAVPNAAASGANAAAPAVAERADRLIKEMGAYIGSAQQFTFHADVTFD